MQTSPDTNKPTLAFNRKALGGLCLFFVGVAGMAFSLYELRESNPLSPAAWTVPVLLVSAALTVISILYTSSQHLKKGGI